MKSLGSSGKSQRTHPEKQFSLGQSHTEFKYEALKVHIRDAVVRGCRSLSSHLSSATRPPYTTTTPPPSEQADGNYN